MNNGLWYNLVLMNLIAMLAAVSIAGNYIVSGDGLSGTVALPGTLADAKLGKRFTQAEYDRIDRARVSSAKSRHAGDGILVK